MELPLWTHYNILPSMFQAALGGLRLRWHIDGPCSLLRFKSENNFESASYAAIGYSDIHLE